MIGTEQKTLLKRIIFFAVKCNASDIYIKPDSPVFYRIGNTAVPYQAVKNEDTDETPEHLRGISLPDEIPASEMEKIVEEIMNVRGITVKLRDNEIDTTYTLKIRARESYAYLFAYKFRVNISLSEGLPVVVMRRLKEVSGDFMSMGIPKRLVDRIEQAPYGIFFITGPTGSGKSTTLASIVSYLTGSYPLSVVTIEDPIEYKINAGISFLMQREVGTDTQSFATGLRAAMRQKPDIILVGEVRDAETAIAAVSAAKSGHRVLTTLHTSSATIAVTRIANMFPSEQREWAKFEILDVLNGITVQALVPAKDNSKQLYLCTEMLVTYEKEVRNLIAENDTTKLRTAMIDKSIMGDIGWTLNQSLIERYKKGEIALDMVFRFTNDYEELEMLLKKEKIKYQHQV